MSGMAEGYWQATFPRLRPRPYQQPHPPLVRACIGEDSLVEMAKIGRPVLIGVQRLETLRHRLQLATGRRWVAYPVATDNV